VIEIRPLVMQMLRDRDSGGRSTALAILAAWKDQETLPQVRALMREKRSNNRREAVEAYLAIDDGQPAREDVLNLLQENGDFGNESVLAGIVLARIPAAHKVAMLHSARKRLTSPTAIAQALRYQSGQGDDLKELLAPLMDEETSLAALGAYCELAAGDEKRQFAAQVRRAMELLANEPTLSAGGERTDISTASAAQVILAAVATYDLQDRAPAVEKFIDANA